jgi:hypothetical protein
VIPYEIAGSLFDSRRLPGHAPTFRNTTSRWTAGHRQGGASHYVSRHVVRFLNETFPDRWLGRAGLIVWPLDHPILPSCILGVGVRQLPGVQTENLDVCCRTYGNCFDQTPVVAFIVGMLQFVPRAHSRLVVGSSH